MNNNYDVFTNDIFNFLRSTQVTTETRDNLKILEDDYKKLYSVYNRVKAIRNAINCLLNSSIIDDILEQRDFFSNDYYNYLRNYTTHVPDSIQNVISLYPSNNNDSYYNFKELYNHLKKTYKTLLREYNLEGLSTLIPSYNSNIYKNSCSVCQRVIAPTSRDLDHFINKKYFPLLCVTIENLVPTCDICNREYKKARLPKLPIVHPYEEDFPIKNIPLSLDMNLDCLIINDTGLPQKYKNYIDLMNLDNRLKHEDISATINSLIENISECTATYLDSSTTPDEALTILETEIQKHKNGILRAEMDYKYIKKQTLDSLMNNKQIKEKILIPLLTRFHPITN